MLSAIHHFALLDASLYWPSLTSRLKWGHGMWLWEEDTSSAEHKGFASVLVRRTRWSGLTAKQEETGPVKQKPKVTVSSGSSCDSVMIDWQDVCCFSYRSLYDATRRLLKVIWTGILLQSVTPAALQNLGRVEWMVSAAGYGHYTPPDFPVVVGHFLLAATG